MPRFRYKAVSATGEVLRGEQEGPSQEAVLSQLRGLGHLPVSAAEVTDSKASLSLRRLVSWWDPASIPASDRVLFTRELATLMQANLPLDYALQMLEQTCGGKTFQRRISAIRQAVQGGASLADALAAESDVFDTLYVNLVRAGEAGGVLSAVMGRLATYLESMAELRTSVINALIYPAILVVLSVISLIGLMTFVVPQFQPLFTDAGATLPWLTQVVFWVAGLLRGFWWLFLGLGVAAAWMIRRALDDTGRVQQLHAAVLRAPVLADLVRAVDTARFSRTLGTLLTSGVPLLSAVSLARGVISNRILAASIDGVIHSLEQGGRMAAALRQSAIFPARAAQLIEVGEESGQLPPMLEKVAEIYDREVQTSLKRMLTILEPVLILGLGVVIAIIIISILVAIMGLNELVI